MCWGGTLRIRKHLWVPPRFRDEWSQSVAGPHRWLQQHTITMPSASRQRVTHCGRESLSSAAPPNHKAISAAVMLHPVQNPPGFTARTLFHSSSRLLSSLFVSSLVTSCFPFHFFLSESPPSPPPPSRPLSLMTLPFPVMDIGGVISWASVIFPFHIFY